MKIGFLVSGTALAIAAGLFGSGSATAQTAPPTYNSCAGPANGNIVAVNPRSCVAATANAFRSAYTSIINGREDPARGQEAGTSASTSWSDNGWTNSAITTNSANSVARGTASLANGTVRTFASNPDANSGQSFVLSTISDIVTFTNTSGSAVNLRVGYAFDGQYINGQNSSSDYATVYLALTSPSSGSPNSYVTFANSGGNLGSGYGQSRVWADGFFDQQWLNAGQAQDFTISSFGNPVSGPFGGGIITLLSIPTGTSQLGFTLSLDLGCRVSGSTCDFGNTSAFQFGTLPTGLSYTSSSGTLFSALTPTAGAVPEPASWAMLVGGFGLIGAAMRRRPASRPLAA